MANRIKILGLGAALIAGSLLAGPLFAGAPAQAADVSVGVALPGIAFGYTDGYWDRDRQWHAWRNHEEMERWRAANHEHYYAWKHDHEREREHGWHDSDRYWDRH